MVGREPAPFRGPSHKDGAFWSDDVGKVVVPKDSQRTQVFATGHPVPCTSFLGRGTDVLRLEGPLCPPLRPPPHCYASTAPLLPLPRAHCPSRGHPSPPSSPPARLIVRRSWDTDPAPVDPRPSSQVRQGSRAGRETSENRSGRTSFSHASERSESLWRGRRPSRLPSGALPRSPPYSFFGSTVLCLLTSPAPTFPPCSLSEGRFREAYVPTRTTWGSDVGLRD